MQYITGIESYYSDKKTAVTLGKFDGLHRGHQKLIQKIKQYAGEDKESVVFAFDMHRMSLLTQKERKRCLENQVDVLVLCSFTPEIRCMEAEDFIKEILFKRLRAANIVVGTDFHFGHQKRGDVHMLEKYAPVYDYHVDVVEKEKYGDREISSTYVREALEAGNIELANILLGYEYEINGIVEYGRQLGRTLGFPTINVSLPGNKIPPEFGVYSCTVTIDNQSRQGICNIGVKPTVAEDRKLMAEVHLFDFDDDVYDQQANIMLHQFIRPETKFDSIKELEKQINQDIMIVKNVLKKI